MITTGSKFLVGSAVMAVVATIVYGITQDGVMGTVGLASASVCLIAIATLNTMLRDSNVFADDEAPVETVGAAQVAAPNSVWPLGLAVAGAVVVVGLVTYQPILVIGLVAALVFGAEWMVSNWSEGASSDELHNRTVRSKLTNPLEYPVGGAVAIGIIVYAFSRVMLWFSKTNTVVAFVVLAAIVLAIGFVFASRSSVKTGAIGGTVALGALAIVAAGTAAGFDGERDIPEFETTAIWMDEYREHPDEYAQAAEEGEHPEGPICESPEEFPEADEGASQTVAAKSGSYTITLRSDGLLAYDLPGPTVEGVDGLTLQRSSPANIVFRNEYDTRARLSVDLGTEEITDEETGEPTMQPIQVCTTLVEEGGAQLLTLTVGAPNILFEGIPNANGPAVEDPTRNDGYWFFVPGVDTAKLELLVP